MWQHPVKNDEVLIDYVSYGWEEKYKAENKYYDITQPIGEVRPSVVTLRRDLREQIERRQAMYEKYGLADMYYKHLDQRLSETIENQIVYLENQKYEGWEFNKEVAIGEITTAFYASYENAYTPHSPESLSR